MQTSKGSSRIQRGQTGADNERRDTRICRKRVLSGAKISEIARRTSVADGTIYLYFGNKDELLFHVFEVTLETFLERARAAVARSVDPEQLELFIHEHPNGGNFAGPRGCDDGGASAVPQIYARIPSCGFWGISKTPRRDYRKRTGEKTLPKGPCPVGHSQGHYFMLDEMAFDVGSGAEF